MGVVGGDDVELPMLLLLPLLLKDPESSRIPEMANSGQSAGVGSEEARIPRLCVSAMDA